MTIILDVSYTIASVAISISLNYQHYFICDKCQILVIISRTKLPQSRIFVGEKEITLDNLVALI